jgi:hypothetical protein
MEVTWKIRHPRRTRDQAKVVHLRLMQLHQCILMIGCGDEDQNDATQDKASTVFSLDAS